MQQFKVLQLLCASKKDAQSCNTENRSLDFRFDVAADLRTAMAVPQPGGVRYARSGIPLPAVG